LHSITRSNLKNIFHVIPALSRNLKSAYLSGFPLAYFAVVATRAKITGMTKREKIIFKIGAN